jgi:uncharacterized protein (DUF4415 family)
MSKKATIRASARSKVGKGRDGTNLERVAARTDLAIRKAVASDPDTFVPDEAWFRQAKIVKPPAKETVTLRLDPDILSWFRKDGRGYQTRINAILRAFVQANSRAGHRSR